MKYIALIRHGETCLLRDNPKSISSNDDSLSEKGKLQAVAIARRVRSLKPEIIISSQLMRSRETAHVLSEVIKAKCIFSSALNEFHVAPDDTKVERTEEGISRSIGFLMGLWPFYERIAVVSHQSILSTMLQFILNARYAACKKHFREPGSMVLLRYDWSRGDTVWTIVPEQEKGAKRRLSSKF